MKPLQFAVAFAVGASICTAQGSKIPTKAELALQTPPVTSVTPPSPLGGGSDDCLNAATQDAISGTGNFAVDMTLSTTSATPAPGCGNMTKDVWFQWTATFTGTAGIQLCGHTTSDTMLAVWTGAGCPTGTATACNDDSCGLVSALTFAATSGSIYMVQVGMYANGTGVLTSMDITNIIPPTNDDCSAPIALPAGTSTQAYDTSLATTGSQGQGESLCLDYTTTGIGKDIWYTWTPTMSGTVTVTTCGLAPGFDTKIAVYDGAGCPAAGAIACNDDEGHSPTMLTYTCTSYNFNSTLTFTSVCGNTYTIQVGQYPFSTTNITASFSVTETGTACATPSTPFCDGSAVGTTCLACGNNGGAGRGCANSSFAAGGLLTNSGNASIGADTLVLTASSITGPGLFFRGTGLAANPITFGDGMLCAAVGIVRMGVVFPVAGSASYPGGLTPAPIHIAGGDASGDTRHYQCWYRDAVVFCSASTFNLTQGLTLTWIP
jgi:hypothetical protein